MAEVLQVGGDVKRLLLTDPRMRREWTRLRRAKVGQRSFDDLDGWQVLPSYGVPCSAFSLNDVAYRRLTT
jgi:hypothetical protein